MNNYTLQQKVGGVMHYLPLTLRKGGGMHLGLPVGLTKVEI